MKGHCIEAGKLKLKGREGKGAGEKLWQIWGSNMEAFVVRSNALPTRPTWRLILQTEFSTTFIFLIHLAPVSIAKKCEKNLFKNHTVANNFLYMEMMCLESLGITQ